MFLDTDREVCDFRRICHATNAAVETYRCGVWRDRYARRYDMPEKVRGQSISMIYKIRSKLLRKSAKFLRGQHPREIRCMEILRDLIVGERATVTASLSPVLKLYENHMQTYQLAIRPTALRTTSEKLSVLYSARASSERSSSAWMRITTLIRSYRRCSSSLPIWSYALTQPKPIHPLGWRTVSSLSTVTPTTSQCSISAINGRFP